jgi:AMMECR1 domain-containing protein
MSGHFCKDVAAGFHILGEMGKHLRTGWVGLAFLLLATVSRAQTFDEQKLIVLARSAVVAEVTHTPLSIQNGNTPPQAVFITIESHNQVLGCRGSLTIRYRSLEQEVIADARSAAQHDPRYKPLTPAQLKDFKVTVTIVDRLEPIDNVNGLEPADGLVLDSNGAKGIVLPWEGKDPHIRLQWAYKKAGVAFGSSGKLYKLIAQRFRG